MGSVSHGIHRDAKGIPGCCRFPWVPTVIFVSVDHEGEELVYLQVARIVRDWIGSGRYSRRLPSLKSVEQELGVSHGSVERAYRLLADEGLIRPVIGRGYFVVQPGRPG